MSAKSPSSESAQMAGYQDYKTLEIARKGAAIQLTMNNPPMNSVEPETHRELATIF
jgi:enoyl-CoA hydratase/carnithine racemase